MARIFSSSVNLFHLLRVQEIVRIPITVKDRGVDRYRETLLEGLAVVSVLLRLILRRCANLHSATVHRAAAPH